MSKFLLTGAMLLLLASFLHYSPATTTNEVSTQPVVRQEKTFFPISEQIKLARMNKKMSQKDLAKELSWTLLTVERIESGQVVPTKSSVQRLEEILQTRFTKDSY